MLNMNLDKEKLTKKIVDTIKPDEIIYAEYSSGGAMGNCGSSRIYALKDDGLHYYYASVSSKEKSQEEAYSMAVDLLFGLADKNILDKTYGGFGNIAFKKKDITFDRNDDKCSFVYDKCLIEASVLGVYNNVARAFAKKKITEEVMDSWNNPDNYSALLVDERMLLNNYAEYYKKDRLEITLSNYIDAIDEIRHLNHLDTNFATFEQISSGRDAIAKYRLRYLLEKLGKNDTEGIFYNFDIKKAKSGDLFTSISKKLGEDISEKFTKYEVIKTNNSNTDDLSGNIEQLFRYPVVVDFSDEAHKTISEDIAKINSSDLRARRSIGYYLASCHYTLGKLPLQKVLPTALQVLRKMPKDDFNYTNTDQTYYAASWLVDRAWSAITEGEDDYSIRFGNIIYNNIWPQIDGVWPIKHYGEYKLTGTLGEGENDAGTYIFERALGFILALDNLDELNPELYNFLKKDGWSPSIDIRRKKFLLNIANLEDKNIFKQLREYMKKAHPMDIEDNLNDLGLYFPTTIRRADFLIDALLDEQDELFSDTRDIMWIKLLSTVHYKGIGKHILQRMVDNFEKIAELLGERRIVDVYFAACTGADEEDEVVLLKEFKEKLQSIEIKKDENSELIERNIKVLESTFTAAKKHIEETAFQRKELRTWLDKEYPNLIKIESSENDSDLYITRTTT